MTPDVTMWSVVAGFQTDFWAGIAGTPFVDASSGGSVAAGTGDSAHPGIVTCSTLTSAAGVGGAIAGTTSIALGGGAWTLDFLVRFPTLSTVAQEYVARIGLIDSATADSTDGVFFEYDRATSGDVWRCKTASAGSRTGTATTTAITAGGWSRLTIVIAAGGAQVDFYIGGTLVTTTTTNIPTGAGKECGPGFTIVKTAGTTARTLELDRYLWRCALTTPR